MAGELAGLAFRENGEFNFEDNATAEELISDFRARGVDVARLAGALASAVAGGDADDVNLGANLGGTAAENNALQLLAPVLVAALAGVSGFSGTLFVGENVLQLATGEDVIINDPVANVLGDLGQGAVNIAYDLNSEGTEQVFAALDNLGSAAEAIVIYADVATEQNVSAVWNDLSPEARIRIQSAGALVSVIAPATVATRLSTATPNIRPTSTTDFNIAAQNTARLGARAEVLDFGTNDRKLDFLFNRDIAPSVPRNVERAQGNANRIGIADTPENRAEVVRRFNEAFNNPSSIVRPGNRPGTGSRIEFIEESGRVITIIAK